MVVNDTTGLYDSPAKETETRGMVINDTAGPVVMKKTMIPCSV
jgi:hypothetical protein